MTTRGSIVGKITAEFMKSGEDMTKPRLSEELLKRLGNQCDGYKGTPCKNIATIAGMYRIPGSFDERGFIDYEILKLCKECHDKETNYRCDLRCIAPTLYGIFEKSQNKNE